MLQWNVNNSGLYFRFNIDVNKKDGSGDYSTGNYYDAQFYGRELPE